MQTLILELKEEIPEQVISEIGYELNRLDDSITRAYINPYDSSKIQVWYFTKFSEEEVKSKVMQTVELRLAKLKEKYEKCDDETPRQASRMINEHMTLLHAPEQLPEANGLYWVDQDGQVVLGNILLKLTNYLDACFRELSGSKQVMDLVPPTFLPIKFFEQNQYFTQYPDHLFFPTVLKDSDKEMQNFKNQVDPETGKPQEIKEYLKDPNTTLSPATCFHVHHFVQQNPDILRNHTHFSAISTCFRYESGNAFLLERSNTFNMREFVFYGSDNEVDSLLNEYEVKLIELLNRLPANTRLNDCTDNP
ncbi:seryl-tRNA synthetase [compost metagenome]